MKKMFLLSTALVLATFLSGCDIIIADDEDMTCLYRGDTYEDGESFDAGDSCNTCTCLGGDVGCTQMLCDEKLSCEYEGETYEDGESFDAGDDCNTCTCDDGDVACTLKDCDDGDDDDDDNDDNDDNDDDDVPYTGANYITLTTPQNDSEHYLQPIIFEGDVSPNTEKIVVTFSYDPPNDHGVDPHALYEADVYQLQDFEKGDSSFVYRAKFEWDNLTFGENFYEFKAYYEDGTTRTANVNIRFVQ